MSQVWCLGCGRSGVCSNPAVAGYQDTTTKNITSITTVPVVVIITSPFHVNRVPQSTADQGVGTPSGSCHSEAASTRDIPDLHRGGAMR